MTLNYKMYNKPVTNNSPI